MATEKIHVCIDQPEKITANLEGGPELALVKRWENGKRLRVHFLGGDPQIQEKVKRYAKEWEEYAKITFDFVNDPSAEIRVAFVPDGTSWSALGTDALNSLWFPAGKPTINFGWLTLDTADDEYSRVVIHEFGHSLGCIHEHQSPSNSIPWNRDAVYAYYAQRGWGKDMVDNNLFRKYDADSTQFSEFDKSSIMLYPIPKELTTNGYEVGWNRALSETDKRFISEMYPRS